MAATLLRLSRLVWDNPILLKELRIGLRERKIFLLQTLYLVVLGFATALFLLSNSGPADLLQLPERGRELHLVLFWCQLVMVLLITPSLTTGQISGEREARTLDLLAATRLRTGEIVSGKIGYALAYVALLLCSSLPMVAVVFLLGGVSPLELAESYLLLLAVATLAGLVGLFYSSREKRTLYATNQTYGSLILLAILSTFAFGILMDALSGSPATVTVGTWQVPLQPVLIFNLAAAALFLFLKAQNHLRRRAAHEVWLGRLFTAWYLADMLVVGMVAAATTDEEAAGVLWMLALVAALVALGCFLDPRPFPSPHDEAVRRKALGFRWWFWALVLSLGFAVVAALQTAAGAPPDAVLASLGLAVATLLAFGAIPRGLLELAGGRWRVAPLYYLLLAAAIFLPLLGLVDVADDTVSFWAGCQASPAVAMYSNWDDDAPLVTLGPKVMELASANLLCYEALAIALVLALGARRALVRKRAGGARPSAGLGPDGHRRDGAGTGGANGG